MQNKTYYNFLKRLIQEQSLNASSIGKSIKASADFHALQTGGFIEYIASNTGGGRYIVKDSDLLEDYFNEKFPAESQEIYSAIDNVKTFRNSKARKRQNQNVILIRGFKNVILNDETVDLYSYTIKHGTLAAQLKSLKTSKICIVENLDSYLLAEKVIGNEFVYIHTYGGMGISTIKKIEADEYLIFPDYDFKGLHNYLMLKKVFEKTKLFIPDNYQKLYSTESRSIKTKDGREQIPSLEVKKSTDEIVVKIREQLFSNKLFLEQQAVFNND